MNVYFSILALFSLFSVPFYAVLFTQLPHSLVSLYLHAYQSFLWNKAASQRMTLLDNRWAVEGDLVFAALGNNDGTQV